MRAPLIRLSVLLLMLIVSPAWAVTMDWTFVGNPSNACDPQSQGCFGSVAYYYNIGTYEVTNAQYAEFLSAKAASDPLKLYNTNMGDARGGITRSGNTGSYTYAAIVGRENMPVRYVSFHDALRFTNWLQNGQGSGDTETGAYTLLGGTANPSNGAEVTRNAEATIVLPTEDEWYKAAYYDASSVSYFDYPTRSNTQTMCSAPTGAANRANCDGVARDITNRGSYTGSASPYGTFDQGGNVWEWNETIIITDDSYRGSRGGTFTSGADTLAASIRIYGNPTSTYESPYLGFRLAMIPEPGTGLLVIAGLFGLVCWRRGA